LKRRILCLAVAGCLLLSLCGAVSANPLAEETTEMQGVSVTAENLKDIYAPIE